MPAARIQPLLRSQFASVTLEFQDADANGKPLRYAHVRVEMLDATDKLAGLLFQGRTNAEGKVLIRIPAPKAVPDQPPKPLPKIQINVLDLDGDALLKELVQPEADKPIPPIKVSDEPQKKKILAPLGDGSPVLGQKLSPKLGKLLKQHKVDSLATLRTADSKAFDGLSGQDKQDWTELSTHAQLQLVSRSHKTNQALIKAGYRNIFDVARQSRTDFVAQMKVGGIGEEPAKKLHVTARQQMQVLGNMHTEEQARSANGMKQIYDVPASEPPCECNCGSAVSPQAYLVDLLDYAVDNVRKDNNNIDLPKLELTFGQPFAALPVDCAFADLLVRQVRLCIEVLHRRNVLLANNAVRTAVTRALDAYVPRAYDALLRGLGTSYRELRLVRSDEEARKRLADRLGIAPGQVGNFRLEPTGAQNKLLNEDNLERLFGLQGTARNPLVAPAVMPAEWIAQRKAHLRTLWQKIDHPARAFDALMVDPDVVFKSDLRQPFAANNAHILWQSRKNFLQTKWDGLDKDAQSRDRALSAMLDEVLGGLQDQSRWDGIADKLKSASATDSAAGETQLLTLNPYLTSATFRFLLELWHRESDHHEIKATERQQALDVLVNIYKAEQFANWQSEETVANIRLSAPFFLLSEKELVLNPLRATAEARGNWRAELERNSAAPLIDPDIISESNFASGNTSTQAYDRWTERRKLLGDLFLAVAKVDTVAKLNAALTSADLPAGQGALFHHIGFTVAELRSINKAIEKGGTLPITPEQYGLTGGELRTLFEVRRLVDNADSSDWDQVHHILVQAEKRRYLYPQWRLEERTDNIVLSPDVFHLPSDALAELLPVLRLTPGFLQWRLDLRRQRAWRDLLKTRIEQEQAIDIELQTAIDAAEEASLPTLRDDLLMATVSAAKGRESLEERKRWVMNNLLINAFENGCRKTTRVAQAIETMQLLLWGIPSRQLEDQKYSLESASAETFAEEWQWLGSYATWRSAMFTYLYPENLLLPELRRAIDDNPDRQTDPTNLFRAILKVVSGEALPPDAPDASDDEASDDEADQPQLVEDEELTPFIDRIYRVLGERDPLTIEGQERIFLSLRMYWRSSIREGGSFTDSFSPKNSNGDPIYLPNKPATSETNPYYYVVGRLWFKYRVQSAFLEDVLYIPLVFALAQLRRGDFDAALYWFGKVYDFRGTPTEDLQGWANPRLELYFKQNGATDSSVYVGLDEWLNDKLNPHLIAATRTGADVRFVILSIVRCLLDYADSEFSKDTSESLARARELYETARRLLDSSHLGKKLSDCKDVIGTLISEIGEGKYVDIVLPELDLLNPPFVDPDSLTDKARDRLLDELKNALNPTIPPKPRSQIRQEIQRILASHFAAKAPKMLDKVRVDGKGALTTVYQRVLDKPQVFTQIQGVRAVAAPAAPLLISGNNGHIVSDGKLERDGPSRRWAPAPNQFRFCIPRNPLIVILRLRFEVSWFKLNNCMNLAGQQREVPAYAAPTDTYSGLPVADIGSTVGFSAAARFVPTLYRYRVLIERAKQLVAMAQQMEATYLSFLENRDLEAYNILKARQDLGIARANVTLQDLRVTEAKDGKSLAQEQFNRTNATFKHYKNLIDSGLLQSEEDANLYFGLNILLQGAVALLTTGGAIVAGLAAGGVFGTATTGVGGFFSALAGGGGAAAAAMSLSQTALSSTTGALASASSYYSTKASLERREEEWKFQKDLAVIDKLIATAQQTLAKDHYDITVQEKRISELSAENASDVVNFLNTKFTNAELYAWMGGIVGGIYRYLLQEATTIAKLAQRQLAFERQETELAVVLDDYWTYTDTSAILLGSSQSTDRRGMTGSARLLQDITRLDQEAFLTDRRKLQLNKTFSLALHEPIAFARFQESGVLPFSTTLEQFDRNFPGHYLRLIKRVRVSVIALVPPTEGIRATLSSSGISRVVRGGDTFAEVEIRRDPETIAFTSSINATGLFDLQEQPEMLLPFEGNGVATTGWTFSMPRAANVVDYSTIADVLLTIEYTALESAIYRKQVIQQLDQTASGERPFSFRHQFADCWYDLNNPELLGDDRQMRVTFETRRSDFPPNVTDLHIEHVSLYFVRQDGFTNEIHVEHLLFTESGRAGQVGGAATTNKGLISTREANAGSWLPMQGKQPIGKWDLNLLKPGLTPSDSDEVKGWFKNGKIKDILFVITFGGTTPEWPA